MKRFSLPLALLLCLVACSSSDGEQCATQSDCFVGERCIEGICGQDIAGGADVGAGDTTNQTTEDSGARGPVMPEADAGMVGDSSTEPPPPPVPRTTCVVDLFTECIDPTGELGQDQIESGAANESPAPGNRQYNFLVSSCSANSVPGRLLWEVNDTDMLCAAESADFYRTSIYRCKAHEMILTVKFTLEPVCDDEEVRMEAYRFIDGAYVEQPCDEYSPCQRDGATLSRRFIIPAGTGLMDYQLGIVSEQAHTMFKYRFDAELRIR